jgi:hypothetical protein
MRVSVFSKNEVELRLSNGKKILFSFGKPVAVLLPKGTSRPVVAHLSYFTADGSLKEGRLKHIRSAYRRWKGGWNFLELVQEEEADINRLAR